MAYMSDRQGEAASEPLRSAYGRSLALAGIRVDCSDLAPGHRGRETLRP